MIKKYFVTIFTFFMFFTFGSFSVFACQSFKVKGMTCGGCESKVKAQLQKLKGIEDVKVDIETGTVNLHFKKGMSVTQEEVEAAIKAAGFEVTELNLRK